MIFPKFKAETPSEKPVVPVKPTQGGTKQNIDEWVEAILKRTAYLNSLNPAQPEFLGKNVAYPIKKRRLIFRLKTLPDITDLRDDIIKPPGEAVHEGRKQLRRLLKSHPYDPDLRVLKAIQLMHDTNQSGLDEKRLEVLRKAVTESAVAIYNDGLSIFNATWFIKIYLKYLELLYRRVSSEHQSVRSNFHWQIRKASEQLHVLVLHLSLMFDLKKYLSGLTLLNTKLRGSAFIYGCIPKTEITQAAQLLTKGETATTESGKTANYVIWVTLTLGSILARIPVMHKLVSELLNAIPDGSYELALQKKMIGTIIRVTEYQATLAAGNSKDIESSAINIYRRCQEVIKKHLNGRSTLKKTYEVDPYLKAAWAAKELQGLADPALYRQMLEESLNHLNLVLQSNTDVKDSNELATKLRDDLEKIISSYGWPLNDSLKN